MARGWGVVGLGVGWVSVWVLGWGGSPSPSPSPSRERGFCFGGVGFLFGFWVGGVHPLPSPLPLGRGDFGLGALGLALGFWCLGLGLPGLLGLLVGLRRGLLVVRCSRIGLLGSLWIPGIWCVGRLGVAVAGGVRRRVLLSGVFGGIRSRRCRGRWVIGGGSSGDGGGDVGGGTRGFVRRRWGGGGGGGRWRWIGGVGAWLLFLGGWGCF